MVLACRMSPSSQGSLRGSTGLALHKAHTMPVDKLPKVPPLQNSLTVYWPTTQQQHPPRLVMDSRPNINYPAWRAAQKAPSSTHHGIECSTTQRSSIFQLRTGDLDARQSNKSLFSS
ncbi:hypothetical protein NMY22_g11017 [Coprinellus aureogranulatus]|nr:hypothetical protein NMY22_g11017 [Coprinellus aureogranulatus]